MKMKISSCRHGWPASRLAGCIRMKLREEQGGHMATRSRRTVSRKRRAVTQSSRERSRPMAKQAERKSSGNTRGKPNILVIWGDDIGIWNLSCYSHGTMGYRTPNIDRIAKEGMMFTDSYGEQSCTAGRAAFITGQSVFRTGLSKVGIPGADVG